MGAAAAVVRSLAGASGVVGVLDSDTVLVKVVVGVVLPQQAGPCAQTSTPA